MIDVLIDVLIDYAALLDQSNDDVLDPDVAVKHLESLAATLQNLSPSEREILRKSLAERAAKLKRDPVRLEFGQWLGQMPVALDLLD